MKKKHDILKKEGGTLMRFYKNQHQFYIEIDLHARNMYVCVINNLGEKVFHKNMTCSVDNLEIITNTFGNDIVIGVECIFTWYWIANFCAERNIEFALGHALYMAAIYKGKTKSDKIDSEKIANMLRGGFFPVAYAYPKQNRDTISEKFSNPAVVDMVDSDLYLYDQYHLIISKIEKQIGSISSI